MDALNEWCFKLTTSPLFLRVKILHFDLVLIFAYLNILKYFVVDVLFFFFFNEIEGTD